MPGGLYCNACSVQDGQPLPCMLITDRPDCVAEQHYMRHVRLGQQAGLWRCCECIRRMPHGSTRLQAAAARDGVGGRDDAGQREVDARLQPALRRVRR